MTRTEILAWTERADRLVAKRRRGYVQLTDKQRQHIALLREQQASKRPIRNRVRAVLSTWKVAAMASWGCIAALLHLQSPSS